MIRIDPTAKVSPLADIEDSVRGTLIEIGARTLIDAFVKIKPAAWATSSSAPTARSTRAR